MGNPPGVSSLAFLGARSIQRLVPRVEESDVVNLSNAHTVLVALGWWI
jgi:hypothetical protein